MEKMIMENGMETLSLELYLPWLAGHEDMEKKMETTILGFERDYYKDPFLHSKVSLRS